MIQRQTGEVTYFYLNTIVLGSIPSNITPTIEIRDIDNSQFFDFNLQKFSSDESSNNKTDTMSYLSDGTYTYRFDHSIINTNGSYRVLYRIDNPIYVAEDDYEFSNIKLIKPNKIASYDYTENKLNLLIYLKDKFNDLHSVDYLELSIRDNQDNVIYNLEHQYGQDYINLILNIELDKSKPYYLHMKLINNDIEYKALEYFYTVG